MLNRTRQKSHPAAILKSGRHSPAFGGGPGIFCWFRRPDLASARPRWQALRRDWLGSAASRVFTVVVNHQNVAYPAFPKQLLPQRVATSAEDTQPKALTGFKCGVSHMLPCTFTTRQHCKPLSPVAKGKRTSSAAEDHSDGSKPIPLLALPSP